MRRGLVDPTLLTRKDFWRDLRDSQANPDDTTSIAWNMIGPMGSAVAKLSRWSRVSAEGVENAAQPVVNPLRHVGRNDPCPCGSGRKFKNAAWTQDLRQLGERDYEETFNRYRSVCHRFKKDQITKYFNFN